MSLLSFLAAAGCNGSNSNGVISSGGTGLPTVCANDQTLQSIFIIVFEVIGALALLFFVIAATRYVFSKGEPENIEKSKNEMKYSLMGLIIAALAWTLVKYVIGWL